MRVLAFARLRELLGGGEVHVAIADGSTVADLVRQLAGHRAEHTAALSASRVARNGRLAGLDEVLGEDDEIALLPPVGGG